MAVTTWEVSAYRLRNDDGDELTATWKAWTNTPAQVLAGSPFRCRWVLQQIGDYSYYCSPFFQYQVNGGSWVGVSLGCAVVRYATSANATVKAGCSATQQISGGSFARGVVESYVGSGVTGNVLQYYYTEVEVTLQIVAGQLSPGDTLKI